LRALRFLAGLAVALLVHLVGVRLWPQFTLAVDVFLVIVVFAGLDGDALAGLLAGVAAGAVQDTLTGGVYGLYGLADTIVGYLAARLAQRVVIQRATGVMLLFLAAAAAQQAILVALALVLFADPALPGLLWVLLKCGTAAVLGLGLFLARGQWRARYDSWRRSRTARLHWG